MTTIDPSLLASVSGGATPVNESWTRGMNPPAMQFNEQEVAAQRERIQSFYANPEVQQRLRNPTHSWTGVPLNQ